MANVRKKISELTALNSASLDTTIVGVDNGTTYKIELDTLADAVTSRVNILDRDRLSSLESVTSSFETKGRSILSGSVSYTSLTNIPQGIVSQSTDLTSLNQFTASISTASLVTSINNLNTFTASQSTSSLVNRLNAIESISGSWITESETGSFAITGSNVFKGQQIVSGSFIVSISGNAFGVNENPTPNNIFWSYIPNDTNTTSIETGWIVNIETVGTYNVTDVEYDYPFVKITLSDALLQLPYRCNGYFSLPSSELKFGTDGVLKISGSLSVSGSITGSTNFNTIVNKPTLISGSSQLTSSYDTRYVLSGSITQTTWDNIASKPSDIVSGSSQLTSSYDLRYTLSGSVQPLPSNLVSSSAQITAFGFISSSTTINTSSFATTGSNSFNGNQTITGSLIVSAVAVVNGGVTIPTASVITLTSGSSISVDASGAITGSLTGSIFGIGDVVAFSASVNSRILSGSAVAGTVSGSSQLTSSFDLRYLVTGSVTSSINALNTFTASQSTASLVTSITNLNSATSSYETKGRSIVSGSSQLTSSYDSRYSLSGSVLTSFSQSVDSRLDTLEASVITGSVNYVQVLGNRVIGVTTTGVTLVSGSITTSGNPVQIMVTGDANPSGGTSYTRLQLYRDSTPIGNIIQAENSSNLNVPYCLNVIDTPSAGTYTYSMKTVSTIGGTIDFGEASGPVLTAIELKTNTNLPSLNNTFTGNNTFNGTSRFATVGGDEGGEIEFGVPQTNTSLSTRVVADIYQNRFRIFDGNTNGVYIDISKAPTGVAGEITYKASGYVNAGTFVQLDNLKATIPTSGNRSISIATVSGTFSGYVSASYTLFGGVVQGMGATITVTTTPALAINWHFTAQGDAATYIITDNTNSRTYRITMTIGGGYNNNFISIERLH